MKEVGTVGDVDLLLSNMSHHEKTILADLKRFGNVTADKEWRENAAKFVQQYILDYVFSLKNCHKFWPETFVTWSHLVVKNKMAEGDEYLH